MEIPIEYIFVLLLVLCTLVIILDPTGSFKNKGKTIKANLVGYRLVKSNKPYQIFLGQHAVRPVFQYGASDDLKTVTLDNLNLLIPERKGLELSFHEDCYIESLGRTNLVL